MDKNRTRSPGRPASVQGEELEARATLVQKSAELFAEQGFDGTSLRQVAEAADVTPAMVAYYFKDKAGLLEAVVRECLQTMLSVIRAVVAEESDEDFVPRLIGRYLKTTINAPWIPQIIIREVISKDTPLRLLFIEEFAAHVAVLVPERVMAEIQAGKLRSELDPVFVILSVLGMCLFPFIAHPVLGPLLGFELDEDFGEAYGKHAVDLFIRGAGVVR
jgi:AcrR family transcriptional regulator